MNSLDEIRIVTQRQLYYLMGKDPLQEQACKETLSFMERADNPFTRRNLSGHITASAWIVNKPFTKTLLIYHKALNIWVQPGGHIEVSEYPVQAACRGLYEETGLSDLIIEPPGLFDVDVHRIPVNPIKHEPEHAHYDLRFLMMSDTEEVSADSGDVEDMKWVDLDMIVNLPEKFIPSIVRMAWRSLRHPRRIEA